MVKNDTLKVFLNLLDLFLKFIKNPYVVTIIIILFILQLLFLLFSFMVDTDKMKKSTLNIKEEKKLIQHKISESETGILIPYLGKNKFI